MDLFVSDYNRARVDDGCVAFLGNFMRTPVPRLVELPGSPKPSRHVDLPALFLNMAFYMNEMLQRCISQDFACSVRALLYGSSRTGKEYSLSAASG
jgi:hypothetical protein